MISIIIPTLNEESVIGKTLKHLRDDLQRTSYEIIVSDGRSVDKTTEIAESFGVKVVQHLKPHRQTIAEGRNAGAAAAAGEILVFMDADCRVSDADNFFAAVLKKFADDVKLVALAPATWIEPATATWADKIMYALINCTIFVTNNILQLAGAPGECQIMRRSAFEAVKGYREYLVASEDGDMFKRLSKIGKVRFYFSLRVFQTGRRIHKVGWPKLLYQWMGNYFSYLLFGHARSKEWHPIR